jgi:hypothetical protein
MASLIDFMGAEAMTIVSSTNCLDKVGPRICRDYLKRDSDLVSCTHVEVAAFSSGHFTMETLAFSFEILHIKLGSILALED